jgi:hypothetical protein
VLLRDLGSHTRNPCRGGAVPSNQFPRVAFDYIAAHEVCRRVPLALAARSFEGSFAPLSISLGCGGIGPAAAAITPMPPEVDRLAFLCEFAERTPYRDKLRILDGALPRLIRLNVVDVRRKLERVDQPILLCQDLQKAALHGARASAHKRYDPLRSRQDHNT